MNLAEVGKSGKDGGGGVEDFFNNKSQQKVCVKASLHWGRKEKQKEKERENVFKVFNFKRDHNHNFITIFSSRNSRNGTDVI